jgi:hypothetical protein
VCGWADLDQVGIPSILGDAEVVVALLLRDCKHTPTHRQTACKLYLLGALAKDVAWCILLAW